MKPDTRFAIDAYVQSRVAPDDFITAVMENNLVRAFQMADDENLHDLQEIVTYVYQKVPSIAWGNTTRVIAWLAGPLPELAFEAFTHGLKVQVVDVSRPSWHGRVGHVGWARTASVINEMVQVIFDDGHEEAFSPKNLRMMR